MLIDFVSDYLRQASVREHFARDPKHVFHHYGVTPEQQAALRSHEMSQILGAVDHEMRTILERHADKAHPGRVLFWGAPSIVPARVSPESTSVSTATTITVTGRGFPRTDEAALLFEKPGGSVPATDVTVKTHNGESVLTATVTFAEAGHFSVTVRNIKTEDAGKWDGAFKVHA